VALVYVRLRPSQQLLRFLKQRHYPLGKKLEIVLEGYRFTVFYEKLKIQTK